MGAARAGSDATSHWSAHALRSVSVATGPPSLICRDAHPSSHGVFSRPLPQPHFSRSTTTTARQARTSSLWTTGRISALSLGSSYLLSTSAAAMYTAPVQTAAYWRSTGSSWFGDSPSGQSARKTTAGSRRAACHGKRRSRAKDHVERIVREYQRATSSVHFGEAVSVGFDLVKDVSWSRQPRHSARPLDHLLE